MSIDRPRAAVKLVPTLVVAAGVLLLAAAGGAIWHFLRDGSGRSDSSTAATPGARRDAARVAAESAKTEPEEAHGPSREADPETEKAQDASTVAAAAAAEKYGIDVKVVRHKDGLPVPGARVVVLDSRKTPLEELLRLAADPIELRTRASARLRADENGRVRVARPVAGAWVLAFDDAGRGCIEVEAWSFAPQRLELMPRLTVAVRVVDETGAPCRDVEVALVPKGDPPSRSKWRATSGADGLAKIADVDLAWSRTRSAWKAPKAQPFEVGPTLLMREPPTVPVDLDALPADPLVLQLPATGALAFQVVDLAGEPLAAAGSVKVIVPNVGRLDVPLDLQGKGSVPRVGLGGAGEARPLIPERACEVVKFAGPTRAGDTVEVALPAGVIGPIVVGHVTDAAGAPLGGFDLDASLDAFDRARDGTPAGNSAQRVKCDADGAFRLDYSRAGMRTTVATSHQLWLRALRDFDEPLAQPIEARFDVVVPESGEVDVGVVRLAPPPLIVGGRVVDDDGLPVEAAGVRVQIDKPVQELYRIVHLIGTRSAADGRFEIRGEIPPGRLKVVASRGGFLAAKPVAFDAGAPDVTLQLRMGGGVAGFVRLPEGFAFELLFARLRLASDNGRTSEVQRVDPDGRFEFGLLLPELWDFELLLGKEADAAERLVLFHQVAVHRAEQTQDPRLQELDLASLAHLVDVAVRVPGGELAPGGAIGRAAVFADGKRGTLSIPLKGGRALVPCLTVPVPLQVVVPGFLAQTVRANDAPIDVLLYRGYPLRLRISGSLSKFPDLVALRVSAVPRDDSIASVGAAPSAPIKDGEAALVVPSTGRYRARITFGRPPDPNASPDEARRRDRRTPTPELDFEVKDVADEQVVELKVKG
jgi:hypothetical protein